MGCLILDYFMKQFKSFCDELNSFEETYRRDKKGLSFDKGLGKQIQGFQGGYAVKSTFPTYN